MPASHSKGRADVVGSRASRPSCLLRCVVVVHSPFATRHSPLAKCRSHDAQRQPTNLPLNRNPQTCAAGGACAGLVLFTGAEGRSHSAWGEHITFIANQPDLLIATHPNTLMADGMDQVTASRFTEDSSFENVNFLEVFNGWGRHFKTQQFWLATAKWDEVLSRGCRVFGLADDDSMLDFPGVENSPSARPEIRGRGLPNQVRWRCCPRSVSNSEWYLLVPGLLPNAVPSRQHARSLELSVWRMRLWLEHGLHGE